MLRYIAVQNLGYDGTYPLRVDGEFWNNGPIATFETALAALDALAAVGVMTGDRTYWPVEVGG